MSKNKFKIGERVHLVDEDGDVDTDAVGVIEEFHSRVEDDVTIYFANVLWECESEVEEVDVSLLQLEGDKDELEAEFKKVFEKHAQEINDQLEIASLAIAKAEKLSEKYGLPFYAQVSPLSQNYWPASFDEKFGGLDPNFVNDLTEAYNADGDSGWRHSRIC